MSIVYCSVPVTTRFAASGLIERPTVGPSSTTSPVGPFPPAVIESLIDR